MPVAAAAAAASIGGDILGSNAAGQAAQDQGQAAQQTLDANGQLLGQIGNDVNPIIGYGNAAGGELAGLLGIGGNPAASQAAFDTFRNSTNYNFLLNQGLQSQGYLNAPNLQSGAAAKAFNNYAQGMAGNALQGYEGMLTNQEGLGLQGSSIYATAGTNLAAQNAQAREYGANGAANAALLQGQYGANALGSAAGLFGSSYGQAGSAFNGLNNILGGPGSATQQEAGFGQVAGLF